jgi:hypothetical protein
MGLDARTQQEKAVIPAKEEPNYKDAFERLALLYSMATFHICQMGDEELGNQGMMALKEIAENDNIDIEQLYTRIQQLIADLERGKHVRVPNPETSR